MRQGEPSMTTVNSNNKISGIVKQISTVTEEKESHMIPKNTADMGNSNERKPIDYLPESIQSDLSRISHLSRGQKQTVRRRLKRERKKYILRMTREQEMEEENQNKVSNMNEEAASNSYQQRQGETSMNTEISNSEMLKVVKEISTVTEEQESRVELEHPVDIGRNNNVKIKLEVDIEDPYEPGTVDNSGNIMRQLNVPLINNSVPRIPSCDHTIISAELTDKDTSPSLSMNANNSKSVNRINIKGTKAVTNKYEHSAVTFSSTLESSTATESPSNSCKERPICLPEYMQLDKSRLSHLSRRQKQSIIRRLKQKWKKYILRKTIEQEMEEENQNKVPNMNEEAASNSYQRQGETSMNTEISNCEMSNVVKEISTVTEEQESRVELKHPVDIGNSNIKMQIATSSTKRPLTLWEMKSVSSTRSQKRPMTRCANIHLNKYIRLMNAEEEETMQTKLKVESPEEILYKLHMLLNSAQLLGESSIDTEDSNSEMCGVVNEISTLSEERESLVKLEHPVDIGRNNNVKISEDGRQNKEQIRNISDSITHIHRQILANKLINLHPRSVFFLKKRLFYIAIISSNCTLENLREIRVEPRFLEHIWDDFSGKDFTLKVNPEQPRSSIDVKSVNEFKAALVKSPNMEGESITKLPDNSGIATTDQAVLDQYATTEGTNIWGSRSCFESSLLDYALTRVYDNYLFKCRLNNNDIKSRQNLRTLLFFK